MTKSAWLLAVVLFAACSLKSIGRLKSPVEALAGDSDALNDLGATAVMHEVFHEPNAAVARPYSETIEERADAGARYWVANKRIVAFSGAMAALADQEGPDAKALASAGFSIAEKSGEKVDVSDPISKFFGKVTEGIVFGVKRDNLRETLGGAGVDAACVLLAERQLLREPILDFRFAKTTFERRLRSYGARCSSEAANCPLALDALALNSLEQQKRQLQKLFASATGVAAALAVLRSRRDEIGAPFKDAKLAEAVDAAVACAQEFPDFDSAGTPALDSTGTCADVLTPLKKTLDDLAKECP